MSVSKTESLDPLALTVSHAPVNSRFQCISIGYIKDDTENGAASVIRTRDLTLTKGALYRWSYGSIFLHLALCKSHDKIAAALSAANS